jgi:hypothetical protein
MWAGTTRAQTAPPPLRAGTAPVATSALKAKFVDDDNWGTGYVGEYQVTNVGTQAVAGWQLSFSLPAGATLVSSWDGVVSTSGDEVSVTNASWDGRLSPGAVADFGFQVDYSAGSGRPQHCALDGGSCAGPAVALKKPVPTSVPGRARGGPPTTASPPPPVPGTAVFAPYVDMTLQPQDLVALASASGTQAFTLAFVVSDGACSPAWGGVTPVGSPSDYVKRAITASRRAGQGVIISFGGEAGTELAESCSSVTTLEAAYQKVVDTYGVYDLDFDIEGAAESDTASIAMRSDALALLQRDEAVLGHQVEVSLTLPVLPSGFPGPEMAVVRSAVAAGVHVSIFNAMTMDYGGAVATPAQMGTYAIDAARAVHQQLAPVFPGFRSSQLWGMVGITPMIGQNDVTDEVFTLSDAVQVATFAAQQGIGRLSMWSVSRDQQCAQGIIDYDSNICSGVLQSGWAFSHVLQSGEASPG